MALEDAGVMRALAALAFYADDPKRGKLARVAIAALQPKTPARL